MGSGFFGSVGLDEEGVITQLHVESNRNQFTENEFLSSVSNCGKGSFRWFVVWRIGLWRVSKFVFAVSISTFGKSVFDRIDFRGDRRRIKQLARAPTQYGHRPWD